MKRREFLFISTGGTVLSLAGLNPLASVAQIRYADTPIKAVAFDAFPVFDPRPILALSKTLLPEHDGFGKAWFDKIFAYTWLRTSASRYRSFDQVIADALDYTAAARSADLSSTNRNMLLDAWMMLKPWPDVMDALKQLRAQNIRLAFLSNFTEDMLRTNARNAGIEKWFDYLSTDLAGAFKPDPRAYQLGIDKLGLPKNQIAFCAFAAWDAAGASWFGYPTTWVNRLGQPVEQLDAQPTAQGQNISVLLETIKQASSVKHGAGSL